MSPRRVMTWVGVLMGLTLQGLGMIMIVITATLVGLLSLPLWVVIILRDLRWEELITSMRESIHSLRDSKET
tara:strand:+ start:187 stop:402 length:216 start_codon:yes stop_codon:yes gene_type:complete